MRVFLDANVLFSAAFRETGSVRVFFSLADAGACTLVSSGHALGEARRNAAAKHPERLPDLEALATRVALCREPPADTLTWAAAQGLPPKDAPILAAAIDARCHLLVTGDRAHFGRLFGRQLRGTVVALPVDALRIVIGD